jgi:hypothetical protein
VNWHHFRAFLWLRWRLLVNQLRRGGTANAVVLAILAVGAVFLAVSLFVTFFLVGLFALPDASPAVLMYVWDGLVAIFLFSWTLGILVELQRAEVLSLDKFLHLPVSLKGAFLINYLSSLLSLSLIVFLPPMVALGLALVFARGPAMLLLLPLLAGFLLMVTALTYQFQGWLASLMSNKRRRRTIIVLLSAAFILTCQVPNLLNIIQPWRGQGEDGPAAHLREVRAELDRALGAKEITLDEYQRRLEESIHEEEARTEELDNQTLQQVEHTFRLVNLLLPPGWLPLGAAGLAEGNVLPALLGTLGLAAIGTASLWRAYRTTLGLYTGRFTSGDGKRVAVAAPVKAATPAEKVRASGTSVPLLERRLPWVSEQAAAVALGGFQSLARAPEAKMMLLTPFLLVLVFGSVFLTRSVDMPEAARPLLAFGAMGMVLFSMSQLVGNQFGFDRSGFRVFVLSAAPRRDILLGKNLAFAPLPLGLGLAVIVLVQVLYPLRLGYFLAALPQLLSMFLLFCMLANLLSILAPLPIRSGSLKPANPKVLPMLFQIGFALVFPLALVPTLLPLGVALLLQQFGWVNGGPVCLVLSLAECAAIVWLYRLVLTWEGSLLQAREQSILETVTTRAE